MNTVAIAILLIVVIKNYGIKEHFYRKKFDKSFKQKATLKMKCLHNKDIFLKLGIIQFDIISI